MSARTIRLSMPMPPNILNSGRVRAHWSRVYGMKKRYYQDCDARQQLGIIPAPPLTPFRRTVAGVTMRLGNPMDDDNAMGRLKWVWDWLKTRGYILDDRRKNLSQGIPRQIIERGNPPSVFLTLTEITEAEL